MLSSNTIFILKYRKAKEQVRSFSSSFVGKLGAGIKSLQSIRKYNVLNILLRFLKQVSIQETIQLPKEPTPITLSNIEFSPWFSGSYSTWYLIEPGFYTLFKNLSVVLKVQLPTGETHIVSSVSNSVIKNLISTTHQQYPASWPSTWTAQGYEAFKYKVLQQIVATAPRHGFTISIIGSTGLQIHAPISAEYNGGKIISNVDNGSVPILSFSASNKFEYGVSRLNMANYIMMTTVNLTSIFDKIAIALNFKYKKAIKYQNILNLVGEEDITEIDYTSSQGISLLLNDGLRLLDNKGNLLDIGSGGIKNASTNTQTSTTTQTY
tara:strand:+ start:8810 stop:9775 length:966 start_codon:yes stop_codon:yes gene_type:complete